MLHEEHCPIKILKVLKHFPIMVSSSEEHWRCHMRSPLKVRNNAPSRLCHTNSMVPLFEDFPRRFGNDARKRLLYVTQEHGPRLWITVHLWKLVHQAKVLFHKTEDSTISIKAFIYNAMLPFMLLHDASYSYCSGPLRSIIALVP
jgi:hypothetical protein